MIENSIQLILQNFAILPRFKKTKTTTITKE